MKQIYNRPGGQLGYGGRDPRDYGPTYEKVSNQGGSIPFNSGSSTSICKLILPDPEPITIYVGISPDKNPEYVSPLVNGAIYDSHHGKAMICLAQLQVFGEQGDFSFCFDLAIGRLFRIPIVANTVQVTGRFVEVPQIKGDESPFWNTMDLNAPQVPKGFLTPDAPPFEKAPFPQEPREPGLIKPRHYYDPRNIPVLVTGFCMRGSQDVQSVLQPLTRRVLLTCVNRESAPIPIAWGTTHVIVHGNDRARFMFLVQGNHGNQYCIEDLPTNSSLPIEIPNNATSLVVQNHHEKDQDFEVIYYLGF